MILRFACAVALLALGTGTVSAAVLGTVQLNGRDVVLNDDNTWAYSDPAASASTTEAPAATADCPAGLAVSKTLKISACVAPDAWAVGAGTGSQEYVYYSTDGNLGFAIVTETAYAPSLAYRTAILQYAATAGGVKQDEIKVSDESTHTYGGKPWDSMRYDVSVSGNTLSFLNYRYSEPGFGSTQFIFWSLPEMGQVAAAAAEKVMQTVKVGE